MSLPKMKNGKLGPKHKKLLNGSSLEKHSKTFQVTFLCTNLR